MACKFYLNKTPEDTGGGLPYTDTSPSPPLPPAHQPPPRVSGRHHVTWSAPEWPGNSDPSAIADLIYVLMVEGDGGWRELTQVILLQSFGRIDKFAYTESLQSPSVPTTKFRFFFSLYREGEFILYFFTV